MPYIWGLFTGVLLTILVVFIVDNVGDEPGSPDIVNWGYVANELGQSAKKVGEEVRQEVHEATEPKPETKPETEPETAPDRAPPSPAGAGDTP